MDHQSAEEIAAMLGMDARSDIVQEAWRAQQHQAQQAAQREKKRRRVERMLGDHLTSGERDLAPASPALEQKRRRSSTDRYAPPSTGKAAEAAASDDDDDAEAEAAASDDDGDDDDAEEDEDEEEEEDEEDEEDEGSDDDANDAAEEPDDGDAADDPAPGRACKRYATHGLPGAGCGGRRFRHPTLGFVKRGRGGCSKKCEIVLDRLANLSGGLDRAFDFGYAWHRRPAGDYHSNTFSVPGEARRINAGRLVRHLKDLEAQRRDELGVDFETWIAAGGYFPPFA